MKLDFKHRQKIEKIINGALQSAIDAHGPITNKNKNSATKRIYGQLKAEAKKDANLRI